jgi:hypothetical protein
MSYGFSCLVRLTLIVGLHETRWKGLLELQPLMAYDYVLHYALSDE